MATYFFCDVKYQMGEHFSESLDKFMIVFDSLPTNFLIFLNEGVRRALSIRCSIESYRCKLFEVNSRDRKVYHSFSITFHKCFNSFGRGCTSNSFQSVFNSILSLKVIRGK